MIYLLHTLGIPGLIALFFVLLLGTVQVLKWLINKKTKEAASKKVKLHPLDKKVAEVDVHRYRGIIANIGLALSMAIVLSAFEFPDFEERHLVVGDNFIIPDIDTMQTIITKHKEPKPPKVKNPKIEEVIEEEVPEIEFEIDEPDELDIVEEVFVEEEPEEIEEVIDVHDFLAEGAKPVGGMESFYKFVKKNIRYPNMARRNGVQGKVYVQFIVDKDGSLTDVRVMRGIGAGCDDEAVRILEKAPKWEPGKQRGRPVKQRIVIPIHFLLGN